MLSIMHVARAPVTGVWSLMKNLGRHQSLLGHKVGFCLLIQNDWPKEYERSIPALEEIGIKIYRIRTPKIFGTAAFALFHVHNPIIKCIQEFSAERKDEVIIHMHNAWLSGALLSKKLKDFKLCVTYHGLAGEERLYSQPIRRALHRFWARRLERYKCLIVSVDDDTPCRARDLFGVQATRFIVIPNGVPEPLEDLNGCPRLRNPQLPFTVGHVGVIDGGKGWRITAEAVSRATAKGESVRYLIVGDGPEKNVAEAWCDHNRNCASFYGFAANPSVEIFPILDALILPSRTEGLPMVVLEALALGVPVIATAVGGIPSVIEHGVNGFIVARNSDDVLAKLEILLKNRSLHQSMSDCARSTYRSKYSISRISEEYASIYRGGSLLP